MTKLWHKGLDIDKEIEKFTVGNDYILDQKLVKFDAIASTAHAEMLAKIGILSSAELNKIKDCLKEIIASAENGNFEIRQEDEDCHTAIENFLVKRIGPAGEKIHTARSRNDQVLAAIRLYTKDELKLIRELVNGLVAAIGQFDERFGKIKIPGYTHMQKAMPSSLGLWIGSFQEALQDDLRMIAAAEEVIDQSPLGSAAGYGVPAIAIDREFVAAKLGFKKVQNNTLYAQNSRGKFELFVLQSLQQTMLDLNKLATDIMLFTTAEFGFLELPKEFCTGSSIMPQKKNPDAIELLRGKTAMFSSYCHQVEAVIINLPSGYNRDYQLTKQPLIEGIDTAKSCISIASAVLKKLEANDERCNKAMQESKELFATEEAYRLVQKGMPFREAYRKISEKFR